jgi:hypothetical protein
VDTDGDGVPDAVDDDPNDPNVPTPQNGGGQPAEGVPPVDPANPQGD